MQLLMTLAIRLSTDARKPKGQCTRGTRRTVTIRPRDQYEALRTARLREATVAYREEYGKRAGVEGTISQGGYGSVAWGDRVTPGRRRRTCSTWPRRQQ
jgi:hypothetical protein